MLSSCPDRYPSLLSSLRCFPITPQIKSHPETIWLYQTAILKYFLHYISAICVQDLWKKGLAPVTKHHSKIISSINSKGQHTPSQLKFEFTGANPPVLCCYTCVEYSPTLYVYMYTPFTAKYINCYQACHIFMRECNLNICHLHFNLGCNLNISYFHQQQV